MSQSVCTSNFHSLLGVGGGAAFGIIQELFQTSGYSLLPVPLFRTSAGPGQSTPCSYMMIHSLWKNFTYSISFATFPVSQMKSAQRSDGICPRSPTQQVSANDGCWRTVMVVLTLVYEGNSVDPPSAAERGSAFQDLRAWTHWCLRGT